MRKSYNAYTEALFISRSKSGKTSDSLEAKMSSPLSDDSGQSSEKSE